MSSIIDFSKSLAVESVWLFNEMAFYLLLGFFVAGLLHSFFPRKWITKRMSAPRFSSNLWAAVFGVPLPLCSCSVLPAAEALQKSGASKGATVSFLTATPQTGVDSILVTYSFFAWPMTIFKLIAALVSGVLGGLWINASSSPSESSCGGGQKDFDRYLDNEGPQDRSLSAFSRYAFQELPLSLRKWMLWGVVIGALIYVGLPDNFAETLQIQDNPWLSYLAFLAVGIPMYVCSTGSLPVAAGLIAKGFSPGGAFLFLMVGPATNAASLTMLYKTLGKKHLAIFLTNLIVISVLFAALFDFLFPNMGAELATRLSSMGHAHHEHGMGWFESVKWVSSVVLILMFSQDLLRRALFRLRGASADQSGSVQQWEMRVEGLHCGKCVARAQNALSEVKGVESVDVKLEGKSSIWLSGGKQDSPAKIAERMTKALAKHEYTVTEVALKK